MEQIDYLLKRYNVRFFVIAPPYVGELSDYWSITGYGRGKYEIKEIKVPENMQKVEEITGENKTKVLIYEIVTE